MTFCAVRDDGEPLTAFPINCIHCGVPPRPLALVKTQTLLSAEPAALIPPTRIKRLVTGLYAAEEPARAGLLPMGDSLIQVCAWPSADKTTAITNHLVGGPQIG